jgi:hypothetical protein
MGTPINEDDLRNESTSELIDRIRQQQRLIRQLQARISELETRLSLVHTGNGKATAALDIESFSEEENVIAPRFPLGARLMLLVFAIVACAVIVLVFAFRPEVRVSVGRMQDHLVGSVTELNLPAPNPNDPAIAIYLINDPSAGLLALDRRDTHSGCPVTWIGRRGYFEDSCTGSHYTRSGEVIDGAAPRGLDRYPIIIGDNSEVFVNVGNLQSGPAR